MLNNVKIKTVDLEEIRQDITAYFLYPEQVDFENEITAARREVFSEIKKIERIAFPAYSETELNERIEAITDVPVEEPLKNKIIYLTLAIIFRNRNLIDMAREYEKKAASFPLKYLIENEEIAEEIKTPRTIGR